MAAEDEEEEESGQVNRRCPPGAHRPPQPQPRCGRAAQRPERSRRRRERRGRLPIAPGLCACPGRLRNDGRAGGGGAASNYLDCYRKRHPP
ncbi:uncharacterized protein LOC143827518 isoform X2 [Paroedura picta]|uniref:uncharacterized protein LOC143827518 isoform X2 n=1 Tax=Paroedura picta TaxID=143630 RepID=UPI004055BF71